jgi:hypothetical protein
VKCELQCDFHLYEIVWLSRASRRLVSCSHKNDCDLRSGGPEGKCYLQMLMTSTLIWSAVVSCACEMTFLCRILLRLVRAVHKFDYRDILTGTSQINIYLSNPAKVKVVLLNRLLWLWPLDLFCRIETVVVGHDHDSVPLISSMLSPLMCFIPPRFGLVSRNMAESVCTSQLTACSDVTRCTQ